MTHYTFGFGERVPCWLAQFTDTPCSGRMDRVHLVPRQLLRRELRKRLTPSELDAVLWDERAWVPGCRQHHHELDSSRRLRIPRGLVPGETEVFAREHGLEYWLEREYGMLEEAA